MAKIRAGARTIALRKGTPAALTPPRLNDIVQTEP
jgi:hypothetical protein